DHKRRVQSVIQVQAFMRAEWVRHEQYQLQREAFDHTSQSIQGSTFIDVQTIIVLIRRLIFFYSNKKDSQRLIWLCQTLLKQYKFIKPDQSADQSRISTWTYQIKNVLLLCCRSLDSSLHDSTPIAVQLRMLEVFTSAEAHNSKKDAIKTTIYLVKNKYFKYLRSLINVRVPSSLEVSSVPPTPLAGALVDLVLRPVTLVCQEELECNHERHEVLSALTTDLLSPEMTEQFTCFLLPVLSSPKTKFPFAYLVESILVMYKSWDDRVSTSPWLLYAILVLAEDRLGKVYVPFTLATCLSLMITCFLSIDYLLYYIQVLQFLLPQLPLPASCSNDSDDSDSEMEVEYNQDERLNQLRDECLKILDSKEHVKSLESLVTANINRRNALDRQRDLILALCRVCHHLMTENRMQVHKTRLLYTLALNPTFIHQLWNHILRETITTGTGKEIPILQLINQGQNLTTTEAGHIVPMLSLFCALFGHSLFSVGDKEFFGEQKGAVEGVIQLGMSAMTTRQMSILQHIPFVVPFRDRVLLLQRIINKNRDYTQGDLHNFMMGPSIDVTIHRKYLYQDAFDALNEERAPNIKQRVRVRLINEQGLEEAGIDGGGLFREFLNELLKAGFDPNIGFFKATNERLLYPNPEAKYCASNYLQHFHFLGRMLGKALYENMLVELPFASFFLCKLLGRHGTDVDIHNLESLDPEVYKNLLFLKTYEGNIEELALNFTVVNNEFGETQVVELLANGKDIPVTNSNRILYIHLVADYRLNRQIHSYCQVFRAGLAGVIDLDWLRMFDHQEIQVLISGAQVPVDVDDLRRNTNYSGGFDKDHPCIQSFWRAVDSFNDKQKRHLLKFVTSCSRPPLLGFKDLYPAFCVHSAGNEDRLPTASTCMNLLKLPEFTNDNTMKERLLYAIESGAGFELS
ncbi:hypothetical protein QZH41_015811, partial [Actinostola sp. cb2023]